ncbi:hypothetical protein O5O45_03450 [Hahella aquimaris]|uniref:hypothetical protein n=1 Tax=Hahella sp. HNIBRBA332 TaxID=3015983 RepID=UPI00273C2FA1|nr:hypothetical protein [Hahella sp. HNIBRBA332]WLQ14985.1 hypothetical protein O5O45_03450 [Hahella sp. HNIBRBA332]
MKKLGKALMMAAVCSVASTAMAQTNGAVQVGDWLNNAVMLSAQIGEQAVENSGQISAHRSGTSIHFYGQDPKSNRSFACNVSKGDDLYDTAYNALTDLREGGRVIILRPGNSNKCSDFILTGVFFNFNQ